MHRKKELELLESRICLAIPAHVQTIHDLDLPVAQQLADHVAIVNDRLPAEAYESSNGLFFNEDGFPFTELTSESVASFQEFGVGSPDFTTLEEFTLFERVYTSGRPTDLYQMGLNPIQLLGPNLLWDPGESFDEPNIARIQATAAALDSRQLVVVDIEHWPIVGTDAEVNETIRKLALVVDTIRDTNPDLKIGIYSIPPVRNYWTPVVYDNGTPEFKLWEDQNAKLLPLADHVDFVAPSLYVFYPDYALDGTSIPAERDRWVEYATENLLQSRQYGKPIIPWIWTQYHGGGGSPDPDSPDYRYWMYELIGEEFWDIILNTVYEYADGAVVFDPSTLVQTGDPIPRPWSDDYEWWIQTEGLLDETLPVLAGSEETNLGNSTGAGYPTRYRDGDFQVLQEQSTGKERGLSHVWHFPLANDAKSLLVEGSHTSDLEQFDFEYSTDGSSWFPTTIHLSNDQQTHVFEFPADIHTMVHVRVQDTVRARRDRAPDSVLIDRLSITMQRPDDLLLPTVSINDTTIVEGDVNKSIAEFDLTLSYPSMQSVTVAYETQSGTADDDDYESADLQTVVFPPGQTQQTIHVSVKPDETPEADETFFVKISRPINANIAQSQAQATIIDNDEVSGAATKFYVVDSRSAELFQYGADGSETGVSALETSNTSPRGAASVDGTVVWSVDRNSNVYVYDDDGRIIGTWRASDLVEPHGIASDGTHVWIVEDRTDEILWYENGASHTEGTFEATAVFNLDSDNRRPRGITTDGSSLWVVEDGNRSDHVFRYDAQTGVFNERWQIHADNSQPGGLTIDPTRESDSIWIVDSRTDEVFEYDGGTQPGGGALAVRFDLAAGNTSAAGIADPPPLDPTIPPSFAKFRLQHASGGRSLAASVDVLFAKRRHTTWQVAESNPRGADPPSILSKPTLVTRATVVTNRQFTDAFLSANARFVDLFAKDLESVLMLDTHRLLAAIRDELG